MFEDKTKFLVIEIQKNVKGEISNIVWAFDDQNSADSKFYTVLAAAAISSVPKHSVSLLHENGCVIRNETYVHTTE